MLTMTVITTAATIFPRMPRRILVFVVLAFAAAALFVRLGFWQLDRLAERRAQNALVSGRLEAPPVDAVTLLGDTTGARFRRASLAGTPDYEHEVVVGARTHDGSPGVNLYTPVRLAGHDTAMLVNRGWVYSPDGATIDRRRWHDRDSSWSGYVEILPSSGAERRRAGAADSVVYRVDRADFAARIPYPIAPTYLVAMEDSAAARRDTVPASERVARLTPPPLDEGPHLSYAIQWFFFAGVAVAGAIVVMLKGRQATEAGAPRR